MTYRPDIVVRRPGEPAPDLVVAVKLDEPVREAVVEGLRGYMALMRCPVGLLVTPSAVRILEERYTALGPESIAVLGPFPIELTRPTAGGGAGMAFEGIVQDWLGGLAEGVGLDRLSPGTAAALGAHVLPALQGGLLRAAGPREVYA